MIPPTSLVSANMSYVINFISFSDTAYAYRVPLHIRNDNEYASQLHTSRHFPISIRIFATHLFIYDRISYDILLHFTISSSIRVDINIII